MGLGILLTIFLVVLNGFFVAAEFAIVKVRYSQIQLKAEKGNRSAKISQHIIEHLDTYLSATQLGITLASLGLGWLGEPVVAKVISWFLNLFHLTANSATIHAISLPVAFFTITCLHIIFGELAPKSIAIRKAEPTTLFIAIPLNIFYYVFKPFIWFMNAISNTFLRLIGIKPAGEHEIHSSEELQLLVKQSKEGGEIEEENYEIIKNAFDFTDITAKQIMVPRQQVFAIDIELPVSKIIDMILENGYSRIPVFKDTLDNILGIVFAKELLKKHFQTKNYNIKELLHQPYYVIETKRVNDILQEFQKHHIHIAIVMDEFGGTEGIITLEDILEELVGEIQDEDDDEKPIVEQKDKKNWIVQATAPLNDINDYLPHPFELNEGYTTVAGLLLYHCNRIPKQNEKLKIENYEITVLRIQNRTIHTVHITDLIDYESLKNNAEGEDR